MKINLALSALAALVITSVSAVADVPSKGTLPDGSTFVFILEDRGFDCGITGGGWACSKDGETWICTGGHWLSQCHKVTVFRPDTNPRPKAPSTGQILRMN